MIKRNKKILMIILVVFILLATVLFLIRQSNQEKYNAEQQERIEIFFHYNYKDIISITFTDVEKNPMGTLVFDGYFNGDANETFTASIMSHELDFEYHSAVNGSFSDDHFKREELDGELVPVSVILKEQEGVSKNE